METAESFGSKSFGSKAASRSVHVPHNSRMALTLPPNRGPDAGHREVSPYPDEEQRLQLLRKPFRAAANTTTTAPVDGKAAKFPSATVGSVLR